MSSTNLIGCMLKKKNNFGYSLKRYQIVLRPQEKNLVGLTHPKGCHAGSFGGKNCQKFWVKNLCENIIKV